MRCSAGKSCRFHSASALTRLRGDPRQIINEHYDFDVEDDTNKVVSVPELASLEVHYLGIPEFR